MLRFSLAVALSTALGLATGCGPQINEDDLGTVIYEVPQIGPAEDAPPAVDADDGEISGDEQAQEDSDESPAEDADDHKAPVDEQPEGESDESPAEGAEDDDAAVDDPSEPAADDATK